MAERIAPESVEQVKAYSDIVSVISDYVHLRRKGRNYTGLCPFHSEKTPSFVVSPEKRIFHCFGCHESGNHISFVMKMDHVSFSEAIIQIAEKAGIQINYVQSNNSSQDAHYEELRTKLYTAREHYKSQLTVGSDAYNYLIQRGLTPETISNFHLGFAGGDSRFRNRVIFPVLDYRSRTVGFAGRIFLPGAEGAKYINSEDSILFNKRKLLYGIDQAEVAIRKAGYVLVMEGYMDVLMAHQFGFKHSVATMGTALTSDHVMRLKRFTSTVYLAMDSDEAGQKAVERGYDVLQQNDIKTFVVSFHQKDPADFLLESGADAFLKTIQSAKSMVEFAFERALKKWDATKIENVSDILNSIVGIIRMEQDPIVVRHHVKTIALKLKIDEELVLAKVKKSLYNVKNQLTISRTNKKNKYQKAEESLIYLMASTIKVRHDVKSHGGVDLFVTTENKALVSALIETELVDDPLIEHMKGEQLQKTLRKILIEGEHQGSPNDVHSYISALKSFHRDQRIGEIKAAVKQLEESGSDDATIPLLQELQALITTTP